MDIAIVLFLIVPPIGWLLKVLWDKVDSDKIVDVLESKEKDWTWRSTRAISLKTKIAEDRVRQLCASHGRIRQSEKKQDLWRLSE